MAAAITLPALRQNLQVLPGSPDEDGSPRWLLFDVVCNRYFTISRTTLELIRHWEPGAGIDRLVSRLAEQGVAVAPEEVSALLDFLAANDLIEARTAEDSDRVYRQYQATRKVWWRWLLHNYLFFRIPLFRPDAWLNRWTPRLSWLFSDRAHYLVLSLGLLGAVLVLRDWDRFTSTFLHFFSIEGLVWYGLALAVVKSAHELGHAFVAKRQGCRVASIGVAFLVMFPVLYTDTTDAWRLRSRRSRLRIVTAGVRTELYIAMLATFAWNVLPDGPLRSAAFFLATTSWVASLLVNISPFLRFDGYYAMSDMLGVENLQQRAFALGRWQMRRWLFGLDDPVPEPLPRQRARLLIAYAWATWVYRLVLFLGIALLVYHFFFKVLGIFLFAVEILWFVALPVWRELVQWRQRRGDFQLTTMRRLWWLSAGLLLLWSLLPLRTDTHVPAVLMAGQVQTLFAPEAAFVDSVEAREGERVAAGSTMLRLKSPALEKAREEAIQELNLARLHLGRVASSAADKAALGVTEGQVSRLEQRLAGIEERIGRLTVKAPFAGVVGNMERLHAGRWVNPAMPLVTVMDATSMRVGGLVAESSLDSLESGQKGGFLSDQGDGERLTVVLDQIDLGASHLLPYPELASVHGGRIAVRTGQDSRLTPEGAHYHVSFLVSDASSGHVALRESGVVVVEGKRRSWLWTQFKRVAAILVRESGF